MANEGLCVSCTNGRFCETWGEMKCMSKAIRVPGDKTVFTCELYKKRGKDFKESKCQCDDCLKNGALEE